MAAVPLAAVPLAALLSVPVPVALAGVSVPVEAPLVTFSSSADAVELPEGAAVVEEAREAGQEAEVGTSTPLEPQRAAAKAIVPGVVVSTGSNHITDDSMDLVCGTYCP